MTISGSRFEHNSASTGGGLMAEVSYGGMVTINDSRFHGNLAAGFGGLGLVGAAEMLIERTVVHDNLALIGGGAVLNSENLVVRDSELSANTSMKYGNTVLSSKYSLVVENTTISGNTTQAGFTGTMLYGDSVSARFLTVTDNTLSVEEGSGKYGASGLSVYANYDCLIDSSLVALNSSSSGPTDLYASDCEVSWSLIGDSASSEYIDGGNNLVDVNPVIGPLADNGGPTRSHALGETSPAINRGNPAFVPPPEFDQRGPGFLRVFGGQVDIGAFELQREPEDEVFSDRFEAEP